MAEVIITIKQENGEEIRIAKEVESSKINTGFNEIEQFTLRIRREIFPMLQGELLKSSQSTHKKKD
jgi:hypothetical protein